MRRNASAKPRIVGIEDGSFTKETPKALLVAVLMNDGRWIDDIKISEITVDGLDATATTLQMLKDWKFDAIMLAGVSYAGFNLIDPTELAENFQKPIIIVSRTKPDNLAVKKALKEHFEDWKIRWQTFEALGSIYQFKPLRNEPPIYFEVVGAEAEWAMRTIKAFCFSCRVPEPIRVARIIARGLSHTNC